MTDEERKVLVQRLRRTYLKSPNNWSLPTQVPLNRDGPEVADQIEADGKRIADLELWKTAEEAHHHFLTWRIAELEAARDGAYYERNQVVAALAKCFPSGIAKTAIEGWSEDWHGCVYIDLPTGQVSWHFHDSQSHLFDNLPPYQGKWDGHDTTEKYQRLANLTRAALGEAEK